MDSSSAIVNKYAVLIGINDYHESLGPLNYCVQDVKLMKQTLVEACEFPEENILVLTDDQPEDRKPTYGNIHSWLASWLSHPEKGDLVFVYFAGHGRELEGTAFLAPKDTTLDSLPVAGISVKAVREQMERSAAAQKVLVLDACHSGAGRDVATMSADFKEELAEGEGIYTIASCDKDQISYEWPEQNQGVFSYYLSQALKGETPPDERGVITLDAVYEWTRRKVREWSSSRRITQEPVRICRTRGQIALRQLELSKEQQLKVARNQIKKLETEVEDSWGKVREKEKRINELDSKFESERKSQKKREEKLEIFKKGQNPLPELDIPAFSKWAKQNGGDTGLGPYSEVNWVVVMGIVFFVCVIAGLAITEEFGLEGRLAALSVGVIFACFIGSYFYIRKLWLNNYRIACGEKCAQKGNYYRGAGFVLDIGKWFVDRGRASALAKELARQALSYEDTHMARELFSVAKERWGSRSADGELEELGEEKTAD